MDEQYVANSGTGTGSGEDANGALGEWNGIEGVCVVRHNDDNTFTVALSLFIASQ